MPSDNSDHPQPPPDPQPFGSPRPSAEPSPTAARSGAAPENAPPEIANAEVVAPSTTNTTPADALVINNPASAANAGRKKIRFGIRGAFAIMALCSLQFAIISYFGPLMGLAAGIGVCFLTVAGLMVVAFAGKRNESLMGRLDKLAIQLTVAITLLLVTMVIAGGGKVAVTQYSAFSHAWQLQREMGFTAQTRIVLDDGRGRRAIVITDVLAGSKFAQAGFLSGDVVLPDELPPGEFYEFIENNRGSEVTINVATGGASNPLEACTTRAITFTPPN